MREASPEPHWGSGTDRASRGRREPVLVQMLEAGPLSSILVNISESIHRVLGHKKGTALTRSQTCKHGCLVTACLDQDTSPVRVPCHWMTNNRWPRQGR